MFLKSIQNYTCFIWAYTHHNFVLPWLKVQSLQLTAKKLIGADTKEGDDCFFNHRQLQKVFSSKRDLKLNKHDFSQFYKLVAVSITCKQWVVGLGSLIDLRPRKIGWQGYKKVSDIRHLEVVDYFIVGWILGSQSVCYLWLYWKHRKIANGYAILTIEMKLICWNRYILFKSHQPIKVNISENWHHIL